MFEKMQAQLKKTAEAVAKAVNKSEAEAEERITQLILLKFEELGIKEEEIKERFEVAVQPLQRRALEGVLVNDAYIVGEKQTKKVIVAFILKIEYTPQGFLTAGEMKIEVQTTIEEATDSFFYPEDDDILFK